MPGGARLADMAKGTDAHGCTVCPHSVIGPAVQASSNVTIDSRPAVRKGDGGIHMLCCGPNTWKANGGSRTVTINSRAAFRTSDATSHCGGSGSLISGSSSVIIGDSQAGGLKKAAENHAPFVCNCNK